MRHQLLLAAVTVLATASVCACAPTSTVETRDRGPDAIGSAAPVHPEAMVLAVRQDPLVGYLNADPVVVSGRVFAGYAMPHLPGMDRTAAVTAHSCGGMPG